MLDVLVIGGGNAALCAALMAREAGASVLVLESAPREWRGGNSVHTRNLRCMHDAPQDVLTEAYSEEEFWQDLLKVTGGLTTESMARLAIRESSSCRGWMRQHGVRFQPSLSGTLHLSRTNAFFMGGGKALMNAYYRSAEQLGIEVRYEAEVERLELDDGRFVAAHVNGPAGAQRIERAPAWWPAAASSPTANGCARPGARTRPVSGRLTTLLYAAPASTWACCSRT